MEKYKESIVLETLNERGVFIEDIVDIVYDTQIKYDETLTKDKVKEVLLKIIQKTEVINAVITGVELDKAVDKQAINDRYLYDMLKYDKPLYGIDEILALSITNIYGSIALTNFGYFDKVKPGVIAKLNDKNPKQCNTFLDDLVCAIAAAGCGKLAHNN